MPKSASDRPLKPLELAALVVLMAEARELSNPEMRRLAGFDLTGTARTRLNDLGLVHSRQGARGTYSHELTEKGWGACRDLATGERPVVKGPAGRALFVLLDGVQRSLAERRISTGEFFSSNRAREADDAGHPADAGIEALIRSAYKSLATEPGGWVGLADLRAKLGELDRSEVDDALRRMDLSPRVHLIPVANLKSLTERDRAAALRLGGEDNHALSIEDI